MLHKLLDKIGLLNKNIKKKDLVMLNDAMYNAIARDITPALVRVQSLVLDDKMKLDVGYVRMVKSRFPKVRKDSDVIALLIKLTTMVNDNRKGLDSLIDDLPDIINLNSTTIKVANIMNLVGDVSTFVTFLLDFVMILLENPIKVYNNKEKSKTMMLMVPKYCDILSYVDILDEVIDGSKHLDNDTVISTKNPGVMTTILSNKSKLPLVVDGLGLNLYKGIYVIRTYFVDRDIEKYEILEKKKELLELKVIEFRHQLNSETPDPKLKKRIELYIEDIESAEYAMEKIKNK